MKRETHLQKIKRLRKQALRNARRIYNDCRMGSQTSASWRFWEQVARDYQNEINSINTPTNG